MDEVIIVAGGNRELHHYRRLMSQSDENRFVIGVDEGADWLVRSGLQIDLAIGDFDSIDEERLSAIKNRGVPTETFQAEKDQTDTELALMWALAKKPRKVTIYGGLGHRFDHTFANIHLLWRSHMSNIPCEVIDPYNRVRLIDRPISMEGEFPYVSLIPFTQEVTGVTLTGFKYPLNNAVLRWGMTLGISNQLIAAKGRIDLTEGVLLVIESRDQF